MVLSRQLVSQRQCTTITFRFGQYTFLIEFLHARHLEGIKIRCWTRHEWMKGRMDGRTYREIAVLIFARLQTYFCEIIIVGKESDPLVSVCLSIFLD